MVVLQALVSTPEGSRSDAPTSHRRSRARRAYNQPRAIRQQQPARDQRRVATIDLRGRVGEPDHPPANRIICHNQTRANPPSVTPMTTASRLKAARLTSALRYAHQAKYPAPPNTTTCTRLCCAMSARFSDTAPIAAKVRTAARSFAGRLKIPAATTSGSPIVIGLGDAWLFGRNSHT